MLQAVERLAHVVKRLVKRLGVVEDVQHLAHGVRASSRVPVRVAIPAAFFPRFVREVRVAVFRARARACANCTSPLM